MTPLELLRIAIDKAGNQSAFARQHGISTGYLNDVLAERKNPGKKIIAALGLESTVTYRRKVKK